MTEFKLRDHNGYLAAKKRTSAIGNCVLITIALIALHTSGASPFDPWFAALIVVLSLSRWAMPMPSAMKDNERADRRWFYTYAALTLLTSIAWGLLGALHIAIQGSGHQSSIFMMIENAGIAAAGSNSLTPNRRLAGLFAFGVLCPMAVALGYSSLVVYAPLIGLLISYQAFLWLQVGANSSVVVQLREREEQYGTLVNASHEGIIIHEDGVVLEINPGFTRMLGYTSDELVGTSIIALIHPDEREAKMVEMRTGSEAPRVGRVLHKDGSVHHIEIRARNITFRGRDARVICVQDMTAHAQAEAARFASEEQSRRLVLERERAAVEALRVRSDFLANMSHEIRTPLNAIIGLTDLLDETPEGEVRTRYFRTLKSSSEGLLTLVNDILDFSKIDAGQMDFENSAINLAILVEDQCDLLASRALSKGLAISTFIDPSLPISVRGDAGRLGQVVLNLVSNAIKFTDRGEIRIRCLRAGGEGDVARVRVEVQDTGIGVPKELAHRVFTPFSQADSSMSRKFGGTGLGLSICRRLVVAMNGEMSFASAEDRGTTFWFEVPLTILDGATFKRDSSLDLSLTILSDGLPTVDAVLAYAKAWGVPTRVMTSAERESQRGSANEVILSASTTLTQERRVRFGAAGYVLVDPGVRHRVSTSVRDPKVRTLPTPIRQSDLFDALIELAKPAPPVETVIKPNTPVIPADIFAPARILVVEDNSTNQMLILAVLNRLGLTAQAVVNGVEAVSAVEAADYDLILMDCQMPEMDGFEATRRIRAREVGQDRHVPIVALTANVSVEDRERCAASGMDGFVPKPVRRDKLVAELEKYLPLKAATEPAAVEVDDITPVRGMRVLVVDDVTINQKVVRAILMPHQTEVHLAASGEEALAMFKIHKYDLVLMDRYMPGIDGIEATRQMRQIELAERRATTPIFGSSAGIEPSERELFLAAGAEDAVAKPLRTSEFWAKVNRVRAVGAKRTA